jgi:hypothetical protein
MKIYQSFTSTRSVITCCKTNLGENDQMKNLYSLRKKWATVLCNSFMTDMTLTRRSEGMIMCSKKDFIENSYF